MDVADGVYVLVSVESGRRLFAREQAKGSVPKYWSKDVGAAPGNTETYPDNFWRVKQVDGEEPGVVTLENDHSGRYLYHLPKDSNRDQKMSNSSQTKPAHILNPRRMFTYIM